MTNKMLEDSKKNLVDSIPKIIVYGGILVLIWLFSKMVFIPLGGDMLWGNVQSSDVIVGITIIAAILLVIKILQEIKDLTDAIAGLITYAIDKDSSKEEIGTIQKAVRNIGYIIVVILLYMYFGSLLMDIHPALSGIILIIVFIWAVVALYQIGMTLSDTIEKKAKRFTQKTLSEEETSDNTGSGSEETE